jgi:ribose 5-phosphate isomerase B
MLTLYLGADHAGFTLKSILADWLRMLGYDVEDLGAHERVSNDDYPEYASRVAHAVMQHPGSFGILLCGSAEGMCMAANKFRGIRAGIGFSQEAARLMRSDDDANVLCIPTRISLIDDPHRIVQTFLETPFLREARHVRRVKELENRV